MHMMRIRCVLYNIVHSSRLFSLSPPSQLEKIIMGQSDVWVFCFAVVPFTTEMIEQWSVSMKDVAGALTANSDEDEDELDDYQAVQRRDDGTMEA